MAEIKISDLTAKGANLDTTDLLIISEDDGAGGYVSKYVTGAELASGSSATTLYSGDSTIGTTRVATLTDSLTFTSGQMIRIANGTNIVEVTDNTHLPSTLAANTTYVIRGLIRVSSTITVSNDGSKIIGLDRTKDLIQYTGTATLFDVTDVDFTIQNVGFNTVTTGKILDAINYTTGVSTNNYGRTKVLQIFGCEFRGCYDLMTITGFELVDLNNSICWYTTGTIGFQFKDVRHLEISSCEFYNWYDEATATTYSSASMIELLANGSDNQGFAVININSSIIHPEVTQKGIDIDALSTTGFGTISSNTFIDVGLTTGSLFLPETSGEPDYNQTYTYNFDVMANQGLLDSKAGILMTMSGNTTATTIGTAGTPVAINTGNNNAQTERVRWSGSSGGQATYLGNKDIYVSIHVSMAFQKSGGGSDEFSFFVYKNGLQLAPSETKTDVASTTGSISMTYATRIEATNYLQFYVANNDSTANITIESWQIVIRE